MSWNTYCKEFFLHFGQCNFCRLVKFVSDCVNIWCKFWSFWIFADIFKDIYNIVWPFIKNFGKNTTKMVISTKKYWFTFNERYKQWLIYRTKKSAFSNLFGLDYYYMRVIKNTWKAKFWEYVQMYSSLNQKYLQVSRQTLKKILHTICVFYDLLICPKAYKGFLIWTQTIDINAYQFTNTILC